MSSDASILMLVGRNLRVCKTAHQEAGASYFTSMAPRPDRYAGGLAWSREICHPMQLQRVGRAGNHFVPCLPVGLGQGRRHVGERSGARPAVGVNIGTKADVPTVGLTARSASVPRHKPHGVTIVAG